jgi:CHAT domain-containing protein
MLTMPRRRLPGGSVLRVQLALVCTVLGCSPGSAAVPPSALRAQARALLAESRPFDARFSDARHHTPCPGLPDSGRTPAPVVCAARATDDALLRRASLLAVAISQARARMADADALWAAALLDLWSARLDARAIDRAIGLLLEVAARDTASALARNDLAIARLLRSAERGDVRDLFAALGHIEEAFARDSASEVIRFNRAVILERARIDEQAAEAWRGLVGASAGWGDEARRRLARLEANARPPVAALWGRVPDAGLDVPTLVGQDPQGAREYVLDVVVPEWARAAAAGDSAASKRALARATTIGRALLARSGDSSVLHVATELGSESLSPAARRALGAAAAMGAAGIVKYRATRYTDAEPELRAATQRCRRTGAPAFADWVELALGGLHVARAEYPAAERTLRAIAERARRRGDLALEARALWGMALSQGRRGALSETERSYRVALDLFARLGETSNYAFMQALTADVHHTLGRSEAAARATYVSLDAFREHDNPPLRYAVLLALSYRLAREGQSTAAAAVDREAVLTARRTGRAKDLPEALARLASDEAALGARDGGRRSVATARAQLAAVADTVMRARIDAEIARAEAAVLRRHDRRAAAERLDRVVEYFDRAGIPSDLAPALTRRAELRLELGDPAGAEGDLARATTLVRALVSQTTDRVMLRQLAETHRDAYRQLVAIALARGDTSGAHHYAELSRADALAATPRGPRPASVARGTAMVEYVLLRDRVLAWTTTAEGRALTTIPVTPGELTALVGRFVNLVRAGSDTLVEREVSRQLHGLLVAPVHGALAHVRRLVLVTDGALDELPFAALIDETQRPLVARFSLAYAAGSAATPKARGVAGVEDVGTGAGAALLVGSPSWDRALFPDLEPLRGVDAEIGAIRTLYPHPMVLDGREATRRELLRRLPRSRLVHFAGHARVSTDDPGASHIVLAADSSGFAANVLFASDIARLDLRGVRLAVLSACGPSGERRRAAAGNGLVDAFLGAGAAAVIASLWEADDEGTAALMRSLHVALAAGERGDEALRQAQLAALAAPGRKTVPTRVWSAFRYVERSP